MVIVILSDKNRTVFNRNDYTRQILHGMTWGGIVSGTVLVSGLTIGLIAFGGLPAVTAILLNPAAFTAVAANANPLGLFISGALMNMSSFAGTITTEITIAKDASAIPAPDTLLASDTVIAHEMLDGPAVGGHNVMRH